MPEDFVREHNDVLDEASRIFIAKSRVRGQMWLDFPPSDKIRELRERVSRLENAYKYGSQVPEEQAFFDAAVEDAIDIINYAAFLVKQLRRGQRG